MVETKVDYFEEPDLNDPILIEGLPGIGNVGRIAVEYLIEKLDATKFAELHSPHFMPFVLIHDDEVNLLRFEFYYWKNENGRDLVFLAGDTQASGEGPGHFEISNKVIDICQNLGINEMITLGGFKTGKVEEEMEGENEILGAVTDKELIEKYEDYPINFEDTTSKIGMIVGATGLLLGVGKVQEMKGLCLMAETAGFPILTDPKAAESVLKILKDMFELDISLEEIDDKIEEMEGFLNKLEKVRKKAMNSKDSGADQGENLRYIG